MANEFKVRKSLVVNGSGSVLFDVQGSQGQLFSITDSLSGSLFAVKDISGMPVMEAFSDNTVRMGQFGQKALFVSQSRVGIGKETGLTATLDVSGSAAVSGSLNVSGSLLINGTSFTALPTSRNLQDFTATSGQTTFTVTNGYIVGLLDVYVNGSKLTSSEFTATNGTTFVLTVASTTGDQVQSINYTSSVNGISGSGTANYVPKFTASGTIGNSLIYDNGTAIGIGTTSPVGRLDIQETATNTYGIISLRGNNRGSEIDFYQNSTLCNTIYSDGTTNNLIFATGTGVTERMRITSAGNVGIGTTNPDFGSYGATERILGISNTATRARLQFQNTATGTTGVAGTLAFFNGSTALASLDVLADGATNSGVYVFNTSNAGTNAERMRITSGGQVCIGTTTAFAGTSYVVQAATAGNGAYAARGLGTGDANYLSTSSTIGYHFYADNQTTAKFYVLQNGDVRNSNNSYGAISDIKLKENIIDATPKLYDLLKVKIRNYNLISDEDKTKQIGVIAQELEEIFPSLISEDIIMNSDEKIKTVKYSVFVPILIKSIQELSAKVTLLENK